MTDTEMLKGAKDKIISTMDEQWQSLGIEQAMRDVIHEKVLDHVRGDIELQSLLLDLRDKVTALVHQATAEALRTYQGAMLGGVTRAEDNANLVAMVLAVETGVFWESLLREPGHTKVSTREGVLPELESAR